MSNDLPQVRLRKDSLDLYDSYENVPHLGFVIPEIQSLDLAGKFECLFTSNHYFEQRRFVQMIVEPELKQQTRSGGPGTVRTGVAGVYDGNLSDGRSGSGPATQIMSSILFLAPLVIL